MRDGSGGTGKYFGGTGVVRDYRILGENVVLSLSSERQSVAALGSGGGGSGGVGMFILNPDTPDEERLPSSAADIAIKKNQVLRVLTPGGGGYGPK